ncbi:hypothetical protein FRC10_004137 [Ceratobasidium sp. 414]|nr:hypothetical protein FRC10_004137 [Ceratobasidium sp. 414]
MDTAAVPRGVLHRIFPTDTVLNRMTVRVCAFVQLHSFQLLTLHGGRAHHPPTMDYINLYRNAVKYCVVFDKFDDKDCKYYLTRFLLSPNHLAGSLFWEIGVTALLGTVA